MLEREGLELEVVANRLDPRPDGWRVLFRNDRPCPRVRGALQASGRRRDRTVRLRRRRLLGPVRRARRRPRVRARRTRRVPLLEGRRLRAVRGLPPARASALKMLLAIPAAVRLRALDRALPRLRHGRGDRVARRRAPAGGPGQGGADRGGSRRGGRRARRRRDRRGGRVPARPPLRSRVLPCLGGLGAGARADRRRASRAPADAPPLGVRGPRRGRHDAADLAAGGRGHPRPFRRPLRHPARASPGSFRRASASPGSTRSSSRRSASPGAKRRTSSDSRAPISTWRRWRCCPTRT